MSRDSTAKFETTLQSIPGFTLVSRFGELIGASVNYSLIGIVMVIMIAAVVSDPVWVWINNDEEEDTVRFRQRLCFTVFWFISIGLIHIRNSFVRNKNV
jgi:hypothetical protein